MLHVIAAHETYANMKKTDLMELPPVGRISESSEYGSNVIHYPGPLLNLWTKYSQLQLPHDSPSAYTSRHRNHRDNLAISEVPETEATITPGNSRNFEGNEKSIPISSSGNDVVIL
ncbi:hypothetical protein GIB67_004932 [Kingdonia uniflora]|uniref:Uncharacterized protein n=1 Tax=Kingdonia uniflora TaxID=39325 RepID=A0A7J7NZL1_9MAGN|nr:hypothetical protein GIB67_004932 [Kingdonia uniflora]